MNKLQDMIYYILAALAGLSTLLLCLAAVWRRKNRGLERQNRQLVQEQAAFADLTQEKKHLVSLLVHEMRSPLALTRFNTEALLSESNMPAQHIKDLEEIASASDALEDLIRKMLLIETLDEPLSLSQTELNLVAVVTASVNEYSGLAREKQVILHWEADPGADFTLHGNPLMIPQIVNNLLSNAIKFSKSGQTVSIRLHRFSENYEIRVKDEGMGLSEAEQALVFQKFYQKNKALGGNGLGLYLIKWFVERQKGQIRVASEAGKGAEFIVTLPC